MKRAWRIGFAAVALGFGLAVLATALSRARLAPAAGESAALADLWRVLASRPPVDHGPGWAWIFSFAAQHGASFAALVAMRWAMGGVLSLAAAGAIARLSQPSWPKRVVVFGTLAFAALLSTAEAAPWMLAALAIHVGLRPGRMAARWAAGLWLAATLLASELLVPAAIAIEVLAVLRAPVDGSRVAAKDALVGLGALAVGWGLVALAVPGAFATSADLAGRLADPGAPAPVPRGGLALAALFAGVAIAAARGGERGAIAFGASVPFLALGLLRGGLDDVHLAALPALAALTAVAARSYPRRFGRFASAGLAVVVALAGLMPRFDARTAWNPAQLEGLDAPPREEPAPAARAGCENVPDPLVAQTGARPFPTPLEAATCPTALRGLEEPRRGLARAASGFGADRVRIWAERYAPIALPSYDLVRGRRREEPAFVEEIPLPVGATDHRLAAGAPLSIPLGRAVSTEHVVVLAARLFAGRVEASIGRLPRLEARFFRGARPVAPGYAVDLRALLDRSGEVWLPVDVAQAEWRWVAGRAADKALEADRLELRLRPGPLEEVWLRVDGAREQVPPPPAPIEVACTERRTLDSPPLDPRSASRPRFEGDVIALRAGAEEVAFRVDPCPGACLYGEAGLAPDLVHDHATLHVEARAGPRVVDRFERELGRTWRRPFEVPIDGATGVRFVADGPVDLHGLRVAPCVSLVSLVHALHGGRHEVVRGDVTLSGDTLGLPIGALGTPPTEVRLPARLPAEACLAMDLAARDLDAPVAVVVGVFGPEQTLFRVERQVMTPEDHAMRRLSEIDLRPWPDREITLYFGAWALDDTAGDAVVEILRPRVHRCGEPAYWAF